MIPRGERVGGPGESRRRHRLHRQRRRRHEHRRRQREGLPPPPREPPSREGCRSQDLRKTPSLTRECCGRGKSDSAVENACIWHPTVVNGHTDEQYCFPTMAVALLSGYIAPRRGTMDQATPPALACAVPKPYHCESGAVQPNAQAIGAAPNSATAFE